MSFSDAEPPYLKIIAWTNCLWLCEVTQHTFQGLGWGDLWEAIILPDVPYVHL